MTEKIDVIDMDSSQQRTTCIRWIPTSEFDLQKAEERMLSTVQCELEKKFVELPSGDQIWTVVAKNNGNSIKTPLVMVHGFGGAVGFWTLNFDSLSKDRSVYAFDVLGFGRSSRPKFGETAEEAEEKFVESIEDWRKAIGIEKMILLGHSFGGYLSSCYALKYPDRIQNLILADPWGFTDIDYERIRRAPLFIRVIARLIAPFNPFGPIRGIGPLGPKVVKKIRPDFKQRYPDVTAQNENAVPKYIYHCNAGTPSGESAFKLMSQRFGFAAKPMMDRIGGLRKDIPVSFIQGEISWMDKSGNKVKDLIENPVDVYTMEGKVGHHVYADDPDQFHECVKAICQAHDSP